MIVKFIDKIKQLEELHLNQNDDDDSTAELKEMFVLEIIFDFATQICPQYFPSSNYIMTEEEENEEDEEKYLKREQEIHGNFTCWQYKFSFDLYNIYKKNEKENIINYDLEMCRALSIIGVGLKIYL